MRKKIILIVFSIFFLACSRVQRYESVVEKGYKKSSEFDGYKEKVVEGEATFYKLDKKIESKEKVFYFIEKSESDVDLYLSIQYREKDWLYMKAIEFIDKDSGLDYLIDFYDFKIYNAIWKDNTTWTLKVEEHMAFPLKEEEIEEINKYLEMDNVDVKLYSDYDDRNHIRLLTDEEKQYMKEVYGLYLGFLGEVNEAKAKVEEEKKAKEEAINPNKELFDEQKFILEGALEEVDLENAEETLEEIKVQGEKILEEVDMEALNEEIKEVEENVTDKIENNNLETNRGEEQ